MRKFYYYRSKAHNFSLQAGLQKKKKKTSNACTQNFCFLSNILRALLNLYVHTQILYFPYAQNFSLHGLTLCSLAIFFSALSQNKKYRCLATIPANRMRVLWWGLEASSRMCLFPSSESAGVDTIDPPALFAALTGTKSFKHFLQINLLLKLYSLSYYRSFKTTI